MALSSSFTLINSSTDFDVIDEFIKVKDDDSAFAAREVTQKEGIFVGYTSGAVFQAVKLLNEKKHFASKDKIVLIFPDHGSRYISKIYDDKWMIEQGFMKKESDSITYV